MRILAWAGMASARAGWRRSESGPGTRGRCRSLSQLFNCCPQTAPRLRGHGHQRLGIGSITVPLAERILLNALAERGSIDQVPPPLEPARSRRSREPTKIWPPSPVSTPAAWPRRLEAQSRPYPDPFDLHERSMATCSLKASSCARTVTSWQITIRKGRTADVVAAGRRYRPSASPAGSGTMK